MQRLNFLCNSFAKQPISILRAGVGASSKTFQRAQFIWRPTETTSTRGWPFVGDGVDPEEPDVVFTAQLWPWHKILSITDIQKRTIDVLNMDCEGCEYNLIPALSEDEFSEDYSTIMGELHWSYIPTLKRPSSHRAEVTHKRLCQHEDFARRSIECCAFPDVEVKSSVSGELLVREDNIMEKVTVFDLIGENICENFDAWSREHNLFTVTSDWAWLNVETMDRESAKL